MSDPTTSTHPVLSSLRSVGDALKDVADIEPMFMSTADKAAALVETSRQIDRLRELQLRVIAVADDVAEAEGMRDVAAWLTHHGRLDAGECRRLQHLATDLERRPVVREGLRDGAVNLAQVAVITRAVEALPTELDPVVRRAAEQRLIEEAACFGPRALRIMGRRVLAVVAPEIGEDHERRALEAEEREAGRRTFVRFRKNGDGTTDIHARLGDAIAGRLRTYLEAFGSPRRDHLTADQDQDREQDQAPSSDDRRPYDQRLGHAFGAFLESVDPDRMPLHGGDATTVVVTIDLESLRDELAGVGFVGDEPITAAEVRRLACTAKLIPAVLGTRSEILDLGRSARRYQHPQRRAMALRDVTCLAEGCQIPAPWCEAHHWDPWSAGGSTDLGDGGLLCSHHHHLVHDPRYEVIRSPDRRVRFRRRP